MAKFASEVMQNQKLNPMSQKERFDLQKKVDPPTTRIAGFGGNDVNFYSQGRTNTKATRLQLNNILIYYY